ncbi:MAG: polyisoprenoid-binding protein, partial [Lysobacterales bacterium]
MFTTSETRGSAALALIVCAAAFDAAAEPARYELDPAHTTVAFLVEHVGYAKTLGQFLRASGGYTFDDESGRVAELRIVVETDSVDTHHEARDRHLRSGDFLDVEAHPEMTFTAESARRTGDDTFAVTGELTLLGTRQPLTLEATLNKNAPYPIGDRAEVMGVSARGRLKRSAFGMTYGVADTLVGDE